ncbi:MAG: hypothetical protein HRT58_07505 [Crocinitomicaceae bacterium]|nr:hypothetical protein [Flavobacteriales bacterium]NQZ35495.1 hypothetical protein [Crocinitomicaceae bacterium]
MRRNKTFWRSIISIVNSIYLFLAILFITDNLELLEVKTAFLKNFVHFGVLISTPIILFLNLTFIRVRKWNIRIAVGTFLVCSTMGFILSQRSFLGYLFSTSDWNTQTLLYQHKIQNNRTIEYQMQDVGALGYNSRTVEVTYLTPWLMMTSELESNPSSWFWIKVGEDVNELELKY